MRRPHLRYFFLTSGLVLAAFVIAGTQGHGQSPPSGVVVDTITLPAIDRGVMPDLTQAPDSPESKLRSSIHAVGAIPLRVGRSGARYVPGQVIVKFRDGTASTARAAAFRALSVTSSTQPSSANFEIVSIDPNADAEAVAETLAARSDVEYAQAVHLVRASFVPNDPLYPKQWNLPDIDMERAWDVQPAAGSSITVAVVDTGIAYTNVVMRYHANPFVVDANGDVMTGGPGTTYPSLGDLTLPFAAATELGPSSRFVSPHDFVWTTGANLPLDLDGHGTHVSGVIGQLTNNGIGTAGVAFGVKLMPVKVLASEWDVIFGGAPEVGGTDAMVAQGVRYAADNGAKVINMSLGEDGPAGSAPVVEDAIRYAVSKGAFVVLAGGNSYEVGNPMQVLAEIASRVPGAISVAALDKNHQRAFYSSTGSYIEIAAPGGSFRGFPAEGGILQQTLDFALVDTFTLPLAQFGPPQFNAVAYYYVSGTSAAAPHVSGVAAMLMQQGITDPAAVEAAIEQFAIDPVTRLPRGGVRDVNIGFGEVSARATLRGLGIAK